MFKFVSNLTDSPAAGHVFIVSGRTTEDAEKFTVSLANGKAENSNVALQLSVEIAAGQITRSSLVDGEWSDSEIDENRTANTPSPITKGEAFTIFVLVGDDRFHVSLNNEAFCTFGFKLPVKDIRFVIASGDLKGIHQMDHRRAFPSFYPLVHHDSKDFEFKGFIPRKYSAGNVITISATASGSGEGEFAIIFNRIAGKRQLLHINPRFDQQAVVINTMDDHCR